MAAQRKSSIRLDCRKITLAISDTLFDLSADTPLDNLKIHQVRRFIAQLPQRLGRSFIGGALSAWRRLFYLLMRVTAWRHPCVRPARRHRPNPAQPLSPDEAARMLTACHTQVDIRDKRLFSNCSIPPACALPNWFSLEVKAMQEDLHSGEVRVTGQGRKTRIVPLGTFALAALRHGWGLRGSLPSQARPALFVGPRGQRISPRVGAISHETMGRQARALPASCIRNLLRHSFATHGAAIQRWICARLQENARSRQHLHTQVLHHLDFQYLSKIYDAAHPRAKKKTQEPTDPPENQILCQTSACQLGK